MPRLQLILGRWEELVLFYDERFAAMDRVASLDHPIAIYMRRNLHVTASDMFLRHYLERAVAIVGADHIPFSIDFRYQYRESHDARRLLEDCGLKKRRRKISLMEFGRGLPEYRDPRTPQLYNVKERSLIRRIVAAGQSYRSILNCDLVPPPYKKHEKQTFGGIERLMSIRPSRTAK